MAQLQSAPRVRRPAGRGVGGHAALVHAAGLARRHDGQSLRLALDAAARIAQQTPIELVTLASAVGSDPHGIRDARPDCGHPAARLLAHRDGVEQPAGAVDRRALLLRCGVMPDLLSSDVLCVGLSGAGGTDPRPGCSRSCPAGTSA